MKNQLAKDIKRIKRECVQRGVDVTLLITTVALNNVFGFGRERLLKLQDEVGKLFNEYADKVMDSTDYGNKVLTNRVNEIMRERGKNGNNRM